MTNKAWIRMPYKHLDHSCFKDDPTWNARTTSTRICSSSIHRVTIGWMVHLPCLSSLVNLFYTSTVVAFQYVPFAFANVYHPALPQ